MTNQTDGDNQSDPKLKRLNEIESLINEYEEQILGKKYHGDEHEKYLQLTRPQLEQLSDDECFYASYSLIQHSVYIQRELNKENARIKWCENSINYLAATHWNEYSDYIKAHIKLGLIAKENQYMKDLMRLKSLAEQRAERLFGISNHMKYMSDILVQIAKTKRWNKNE